MYKELSSSCGVTIQGVSIFQNSNNSSKLRRAERFSSIGKKDYGCMVDCKKTFDEPSLFSAISEIRSSNQPKPLAINKKTKQTCLNFRSKLMSESTKAHSEHETTLNFNINCNSQSGSSKQNLQTSRTPKLKKAISSTNISCIKGADILPSKISNKERQKDEKSGNVQIMLNLNGEEELSFNQKNLLEARYNALQSQRSSAELTITRIVDIVLL